MSKLMLLYGLLFLSIAVKAQSSKSNQVIYGDVTMGGGQYDGSNSFFSALSLNYQVKHHLFTFRGSGITDHFLLASVGSKAMEEYALLYGFRKTGERAGFHISGGVALLSRRVRLKGSYSARENFAGFPVEMGVNLFKSKARRSGLGASIGVKMQGNICRESYFALGLSLGLGWHKEY